MHLLNVFNYLFYSLASNHSVLGLIQKFYTAEQVQTAGISSLLSTLKYRIFLKIKTDSKPKRS